MDDILTLIGSYAFPIVMWYMTVKAKQHKEEITDLDKQHQETYAKLDDTIQKNTQAINNMTIVVTKLTERIDK